MSRIAGRSARVAGRTCMGAIENQRTGNANLKREAQDGSVWKTTSEEIYLELKNSGMGKVPRAVPEFLSSKFKWARPFWKGRPVLTEVPPLVATAAGAAASRVEVLRRRDAAELESLGDVLRHG